MVFKCTLLNVNKPLWKQKFWQFVGLCVYTISIDIKEATIGAHQSGKGYNAISKPFEVNNFLSQTDDDLIQDQYKINNINIELWVSHRYSSKVHEKKNAVEQ